MYDPLIVDIFVRVYKDLAPPSDVLELEKETRNVATVSGQRFGARAATPRLEAIAAGADEMSTMYELVSALLGKQA